MAVSQMSDMIKAILLASERAATIARSCARDNSGDLLVTEKDDGEANARFEKDFKTIADVLAQQCAIDEIKKHCAELGKNVRGEECAEIGGVKIEVMETEDETAALLSNLVPSGVAQNMAKAAHREVRLKINLNSEDFPEINPSDVGIWIDPIDATAEFIAGVNKEAKPNGGLQCVTVLIGAYSKPTGEPLFGVINQPFFTEDKPHGRLVWGLCYGNVRKWGVTGLENNQQSHNTILMSSAENPGMSTKVLELGWDIQSLPGAGHKLMKVALGQAGGYILSKGTTFCWDTCGPHAVLKGKGGDIINPITKKPLTYNVPDGLTQQDYCNTDGIFAFVSEEIRDQLINVLDVK